MYAFNIGSILPSSVLAKACKSLLVVLKMLNQFEICYEKIIVLSKMKTYFKSILTSALCGKILQEYMKRHNREVNKVNYASKHS